MFFLCFLVYNSYLRSIVVLKTIRVSKSYMAGYLIS